MKKIGLLVLVVIAAVFYAGYGFYVSAADKTTKKTAPQEAAQAGKGTASPTQETAAMKAGDNNQNVATVNGVAIPKSEFDAEVSRLDRQVAMTGRTPDEKEMAAMKEKILDGMIGREILKQEAAKQGIKADEAEVASQLDALKKKFGSEEEFKTALTKMNVTEDTIKSQFTSELALRKLIEKDVADKITLGPDEAKDFYDKNPEIFKTPEMIRASHILVKVDQGTSPEDKAKALEKIKAIQKRIQGGEDFAVVAKEVSDCPSKENGGDLDFFQRGQMVGPFEDTAFTLKPGQVSDIVETEYGYHLIKLTDKKDAGVMAFEEMKPRIEQHVKSEKVAQQLALYVDQLKTTAKINVLVK
jgi:peptidyl-prolyl cis-trans isomerase C